MKQKLIIFSCILVYLFLAFGLQNYPPALNADEASFGYNAYSIFKTGKDEYGVFLPLRLQSFGDFKLPLYSYLSAPIVGILGLSEFSARLLAKLVGLGLIILLYQLSKQFFKNKTVALITLVTATVSPWIYIFSNQAHETALTTLLLGLAILFLSKFQEQNKFSYWSWSLLFSSLSLYTYHSAKVLFPFLLILQFFFLWHNRPKISWSKSKSDKILLALASLLIILFAFSEIAIPAKRVKNLLLFSHQGIDLITNEAKIEARFSVFGQPFFIGVREFLNRYYSYFSPEFLVSQGDDNPRFGFLGVSPINYLEYLFLLFGLYFLLKSKTNIAILLLLPFLVAPLAGSLSWQEHSLSRTHAMILSLLPLSSFGFYQIVKKKALLGYGLIISSVLLSLTSIYFLQVHYPKRAHVVRSWQSGYKELVDYTKQNYQRFNRFYITDRNGQPYIFFLFYLSYPPEKYQPQARISGPDEYGFGSVEKLDKYIFKFTTPHPKTNNSYIGFPDEFSQEELFKLEFKDIVIGTETIFKITD